MSASLLAKPPVKPIGMTQGRIVAFVADQASELTLRSSIVDQEHDLVIQRGGIPQAIAFLSKDRSMRALIVDITEAKDALLELEELSRVCPPELAVVVVGEITDVGFHRTLVHELGVTEYLPKPLTTGTVAKLMASQFSADTTPRGTSRDGQIIAVCGASGGVGASTLAVSTAIELANVVKGTVALLDLNLHLGAAAVMLAARPGPGLRTALEDPAQADSLLLERAAITVAPRLKLIAGDEAIGTGVTITEAGVAQLLSLLRQKYDYIVIDMPAQLQPELHQILAAARQVIVVHAPTILSVRNARAIRHLALVTHAGADRVVLINNHSDMKGGLSEELLEKALGFVPQINIPDLGKRMPEAINLGVPAIQEVPELRKYLAPIIQHIAAVGPSKTSNSWIKRWLGL